MIHSAHPAPERGGPLAVRPELVGAVLLAVLALLPWASRATAAPALRGPLADSAAAILGSEPSRSTWGILAVSLDRGDTLLALDPERRLIPGSNQKLFTLGAFLLRHGSGSTRTTELLARGKAHLHGAGRAVELKGDLVLRGCGMPDAVPLLAPGSRGLLDSLAYRLRDAGLTRFEGTLWVDGSLFARSGTPRGWEVEDLPHGYGAPVNAILANGNAASVVATAASPRARVELDPPDAPLSLSGAVAVVGGDATGWLRVDRAPGSCIVRVQGAVPRGGEIRRTVSLPEPDSAAGVMLLGAMRRAGIEVRARVRPDTEALRVREGWTSRELPLEMGATGQPAVSIAGHDSATWRAIGERRFTPVLSLRSPTAGDVVSAVAAYSLNPEAEALLRLLDPAPVGKDPDTAIQELRGIFAQAGIDSADVAIADGSGLSPQNLTTARAVVRWLTHLDRGAALPPGAFAALLPTPGAKGTLERRFRGLVPDSALHAKTGTLTNVSALSGYVATHAGERVVFALLSNGNARSIAPAREAEDALVALLARFERTPVRARRYPAWGIPR